MTKTQKNRLLKHLNLLDEYANETTTDDFSKALKQEKAYNALFDFINKL